MTQKILVVIDMQNDFIDGALGTKEAEAIVPAVCAKIRAAREEGAALFATMDTHAENYLETSEGRMLPVPHCIKGTDGWQIRPEIAALLKDAVILEKPTFGCLRLPYEIAAVMDANCAREEDTVIELIGLCTDICVVSNALMLKARFHEADIRLDSACCAGVTVEKHQAALETMRSCQIKVY